ncbi:phospholipid scramblase 2 [Patella vulgata]|uniref:phospholipid scramblase 2 n=1 Tax=Patella vulgata TaxID=6465 RepID=UPI00217FF17C|nr:phospholipid scramblase 2 [Patella vulgata]XP_050411704.1 phospholipid scramblase 2 [Patella vulgata]
MMENKSEMGGRPSDDTQQLPNAPPPQYPGIPDYNYQAQAVQALQQPPIMMQPGQQQMMQQQMFQMQQMQMQQQMMGGAAMNLFNNHLNNLMEGSNKHSGLLNVAPDVWMTKPDGGPVTSPGLEYLNVLDKVLIYQQINIVGVMNRSTSSTYKILNDAEQMIYKASKQSTARIDTPMATAAGFHLGITDKNGQEIIRTGRSEKCCSGAPCCSCISLNEFTIQTPPGQVAGAVSQGPSLMSTIYNIESGDGQLLYKITNNNCLLCGNACAERIPFTIKSADSGVQVGTIQAMQQDIFQKMLTNSAGFIVTFDGTLDAREKAILMACGFFVEANFYAQYHRGGRRRRR